MTNDDMALVREYAVGCSETAFTTLVSRHVHLVYSAALRQVGDPHMAEEVTQAVFILLARKAPSLGPKTVLCGWLHRAARYVSANARQAAIRRRRHEQEALMDSPLNEPDPDSFWRQMAPLLDEALSQLRERDRDALMLRYFENKSLREVGAALGVEERAAQKRVARSLEKLRGYFARRGVTASTTAMATVMSARAVHAAPAALTKSVTAAAVTKGAASGASTLTLTKGALKYMAWTKTKIAVIGTIGAVLAVGTVTVSVEEVREHSPVRLQVMEIVRTNRWSYLGDDKELQMLMDLGPRAVPALGEMLEWRGTAWTREHEKLWLSLPTSLRTLFSDPRQRQDMHRKAVQIVSEMGPSMARPLAGPLCKALDDSISSRVVPPGRSRGRQGRPPDSGNSEFALRALCWSIPDSTRAIGAWTNWLSNPLRGQLIGSVDSWDVAAEFPETVPLLIPWLRNLDTAREATEILARMGSNAAPALPALLEVCADGVASPQLKPQYTKVYSSPGEPQVMNRRAAFNAVGKIGAASPEVLASVNLGIGDTNENIQVAAIQTLASLHQPLEGRLVQVLNHFAVRRSIEAQNLVQWVGGLGANGREALTWLRPLAQSDEIEKLPAGVRDNVGDYAIEPDDFRLSAILAICRIDPGKAHQYLPEILRQVGGRWEAVEFLMESKPMASEIIAGLQPMLTESNGLRSAIAAYIILNLDPNHAGGLAALRERVTDGDLSLRISAAQWLWKTTGETNDVLRLCIEGLGAPGSYVGQTAAGVLEEMGTAARPAVPALKKALWHNGRYVRNRAGKALRKIAPEELPPVL